MQIDQFIPTLSRNDAVGNEIRLIQQILLKWGHKSDIFAEQSCSNSKKDFKSINKHKKSDVLIYHHSIGCDIAEYVCNFKNKKMMIYHNITPDNYFWGVDPTIANLTCRGRKQLKLLSGCFNISLADSAFNESELIEEGFSNTHILPLLIDYSIYDIVPDEKIINRFNDNFTNILFVGKIAPHKNQEDLIKVFSYYNKHINPLSRLFIIGNDAGFEKYNEYLNELKNDLNLDTVFIETAVSMKKLISYYKIASIFLCMSKHEGFCVPLVESMYFQIPIIAQKSTAIPWTLNNSAITFDTSDPLEIAELINYVVKNDPMKKSIIERQNIRLNDFSLENTTNLFEKYLRTIL